MTRPHAGQARYRVGCATSQTIVENAAEKPSATPSSHDVSTKRLHNSTDEAGLTRSNHWVNRPNSVYTKRLHIVRTHLVEKRGQIHYRRRVPEALRRVVGKKEIWRSLGTDSPTVAKRRLSNRLLVSVFGESCYEPSAFPDGHFLGHGTIAQRSRGSCDGGFVRWQCCRAEMTPVRRRGQRVERVSVHPKASLSRSSPAEIKG